MFFFKVVFAASAWVLGSDGSDLSEGEKPKMEKTDSESPQTTPTRPRRRGRSSVLFLWLSNLFSVATGRSVSRTSSASKQTPKQSPQKRRERPEVPPVTGMQVSLVFCH